MKITFVSVSSEGYHSDQLKESAQKKGVDFEIVNFESLHEFESKLADFGEVVIWRSSSLDVGVSRTVAMNLVIGSGRYLINSGVAKQPFVTNKLYQQKVAMQFLDYAAIPTFTFKKKSELQEALNNGELKLPFIQKPNLGARGMDVRLINSLEDLEENLKPVKAYVYQNFVTNTGDYRALMLGGRVLGVMKRVAKEGSILNNVSQGASAYVETDAKVIKNVRDIAIKISSALNLQFCGVDVIYDTKAEKYNFLEVNTVPQWRGFHESTGIDVAGQIVDYCIQMGDKKASTYDKVFNYYMFSYPYLHRESFHFASRLYLWSQKPEFKTLIDQFTKNHDLFDLESGRIEERIKSSLFDEPVYKTDKVSKKRQLRRELKNKYPMLKKYSEVMTTYFFAKVLYNFDITELVQKYIKTSDLQELFDVVKNDKEVIATTTTTCVNFLYFTKFYLKSLGISLELNGKYFLDIAKEKLVENNKSTLDTKIYLLTHTLLGESEFYSKKMNLEDWSKEILDYLEQAISENYFNCKLDMKLEFLVCAKLYNFQSKLENIILNEADNSLGQMGNYLLDQDTKNDKRVGENVYYAEHRSVLYLMCNLSRS